ncbi:MAG: hypothetical protein OXE58_14660 [Acidobacteria bacterium]|nr:hypothetical protein [Acidobacteriota bacterium]
MSQNDFRDTTPVREGQRVADGINSDEFFRVAALASVAPPEGEIRTRNFRAARKVLGTYTLQVVETARSEGDARPGDSAGEEAACPLRPDEPRDGLPDGKAFELAPERGERFIQVPRVLGGASS